tara:strand:+ start:371 stop:589 length:219 start_codon:yes stop_codon:yes gene_type:complete
MSQKKVKGVKIFLTTKDVIALEDLLSRAALFHGSFKKLKKVELDLWHTFKDICTDLNLNNSEVKITKNKNLH